MLLLRKVVITILICCSLPVLISSFLLPYSKFRPSVKKWAINAIKSITTAEEFESIVALMKETGKPAVVDFQKSLCKPCKRIAPLFEKLAEKFENKVASY